MSTQDSDRFSGAKARVCIYNMKRLRDVEKNIEDKEGGLSSCEILSLSTDLEIKVYTILYSRLYFFFNSPKNTTVAIQISEFSRISGGYT